MPTKRTGKHSLSYLGVEAPQPPNIVSHNRAPTTNDYKEFNTGDMWIDTTSLTVAPPTAPTNEDIWMLVSKNRNIANATWVNFGGGDLETLTGNNAVVVVTDANDNINVLTANSTVTFVGAASTLTQDFGLSNLVFGSSLPAITTGTGNVGVGNNTMSTITSGANNAVLGDNCMTGSTTASGNVAIGAGALGACITSSNNVAIGLNALALCNTPGSNGSIAIGSSALMNFIPAANDNRCIAIGLNALVSCVSGARNNVVIGSSAAAALTTGTNNIVMGHLALGTSTTGTSNAVIIGENCATASTAAEFSVAIGSNTLSTATTGGSSTVAVGYQCLSNITTGTNNLVIGRSSGGAYTGAESSNILLQNNGTVGDANTMRLGTSGAGSRQVNRCFVGGIRGVTTGVADAIAVLIDSSGQLGTISSSKRYKQNIHDMKDASSALMDLRPVTFEYKKSPGHISYGLIAEEVEETFPELVVYDEEGRPETVKYQHIAIMLLNEVQKLTKRVEQLEHLIKQGY